MQNLLNTFPVEAIRNALESRASYDYTGYTDDPVGFCRDKFGDVFTEDVERLLESVRDNEITVAISANAIGKTHSAGRATVWFYKVFSQLGVTKVITAAAPPENNLKRILWGEIGSLITKHPEMFLNDRITNMSIECGPSFIEGVAIPVSSTPQKREASFSGKHAEYLLFVLDEADAIPDEIYKGIESCTSGGMTRLLCMFNPRRQDGEVYRYIRDSRANVVHLSAFSHPNVRTGKNIIPGAVTAEKTVKRINEWCRHVKPGEMFDPDSELYFKLPKFLEYVTATRVKDVLYDPLEPGHYKILDPCFSYMVMGRYPVQGYNQLISMEWINKARSRYDAYVSQFGDVPPEGTWGVMGMDVAGEGDDENVVCYRYGGYVAPMEAWTGVDPLESAIRATKMFKRGTRLNYAMIDANGLGAGVAPYMNRELCPAGAVMVQSKPTADCEHGRFKILRDQLMWDVREWLRTDQWAMLPPDEMLIEELLVPNYIEENGFIRVDQNKVIKSQIGRSADRFTALMMTHADDPGLIPNTQPGALLDRTKINRIERARRKGMRV